MSLESVPGTKQSSVVDAVQRPAPSPRAFGMTHKQAETLRWLAEFQRQNGGVSPSFQQIADGVPLSSKSDVSRILKALEERHYVRRLRYRNRAIEVLAEFNPNPVRPVAKPANSYSTEVLSKWSSDDLKKLAARALRIVRDRPVEGAGE